MQLFKKILLVAAIMVGIVAIIGWFLPEKISLERSLVMKAAPPVIYEQVNTLKNWEKWSPWFKMDTAQVITYNTIPSGTGASYHWKGSKTMEGTITIVESKLPEQLVTRLEFEGEEHPATSTFRFTPEGTGTRVDWSFEATAGANPFGRIFWYTAGKSMIGQSFEEGLFDLNRLTEKMPALTPTSSTLQVKERTQPETHYLYIHDSASTATVGQKLGMGFGRIMAAVQKQGLTVTGAPFGIYYTASTTQWEMDICLPVNKAGKADGDIKPGLYKGGNMVVAAFYGPYDQTPAGHAAAGEYMRARGKKITGAPWECYITDPMAEKDTAKWLTEICYPVE